MNSHQLYHPVFAYRRHEPQILKNELLKRLHEENTRFFLSETEGESSGMLIASFREISEGLQYHRKGYIAETVVKEKYRGSGIGHALFEAAKSWLVSLGADHIELQVSVQNPDAFRFWSSLGFTPSTQHMVKIVET